MRSPAFAALLMHLPLLFFLAQFPQGPDGAEMLSTATAGGVLHPSGMPLQAWINILFAKSSLTQPAFGLSLFSWICSLGACTWLMLAAMELGFGRWPAFVASAVYLYTVPVVALAVQPEKYALLACLSALELFLFVKAIRQSENRVFVALVFALGLAQHTAFVVHAPLLAVLHFVEIKRHGVKQGLQRVMGDISLIFFIVAAFYISLLWMRSSRAWPDWGHLSDLTDVWNHFRRSDFADGVINLDRNKKAVGLIDGLDFLWRVLRQWTILLPLIPAGWLMMARTANRPVWVGYALVMVAGLLTLRSAVLPAGEDGTRWAYGERYPCLVLPLFCLFMAAGLDGLWRKAPSRFPGRVGRFLCWLFVLIGLTGVFYRSVQALREVHVNEQLISIYREEAGREYIDGALFVSTSEWDLFYGLPCASSRDGSCFPIKNIFGSPWYRERAAPAMDSRVGMLLKKYMDSHVPWNYQRFLQMAFESGIVLLSTSGDLFVDVPAFQGHIEQRGLVWLVDPRPRPLYSDAIVESAQRLCARLIDVRGLNESPINGFFAEIREKFRLVYRSAHDALELSGRNPSDALSSCQRVYPLGP